MNGGKGPGHPDGQSGPLDQGVREGWAERRLGPAGAERMRPARRRAEPARVEIARDSPKRATADFAKESCSLRL